MFDNNPFERPIYPRRLSRRIRGVFPHLAFPLIYKNSAFYIVIDTNVLFYTFSHLLRSEMPIIYESKGVTLYPNHHPHLTFQLNNLDDRVSLHSVPLLFPITIFETVF